MKKGGGRRRGRKGKKEINEEKMGWRGKKRKKRKGSEEGREKKYYQRGEGIKEERKKLKG